MKLHQVEKFLQRLPKGVSLPVTTPLPLLLVVVVFPPWQLLQLWDNSPGFSFSNSTVLGKTSSHPKRPNNIKKPQKLVQNSDAQSLSLAPALLPIPLAPVVLLLEPPGLSLLRLLRRLGRLRRLGGLGGGRVPGEVPEALLRLLLPVLHLPGVFGTLPWRVARVGFFSGKKTETQRWMME